MAIVMAILTIIVSLIGSGAVSAFVTHRLATAEKATELRRQKLEKLYLYGVDVHNSMISHVVMAAAYHSGKLDKSHISKHFEDNIHALKEANNNLTMLCNLYFPELVPHLNQIHQVRDAIATEGFTAAAHGDTPDRQKGSRVLAEFSNVGSAFEEFNQQVFKVGLQINGHPATVTS